MGATFGDLVRANRTADRLPVASAIPQASFGSVADPRQS